MQGIDFHKKYKYLLMLALLFGAILLLKPSAMAETIIIDNGDPETSYTLEKWWNSSGVDFYGTQSVFSRKANNKYNYDVTLSGSYDISLWWTSSLSRCTSVPVEIYDGTTLLDTVTVNHQENGGDWNPIGIGAYTFTGQAKVSIVSTAVGSCTTSADAVKFVSSGTPGNTAPVVAITLPADGSSFNEGDSITFTGTASDIEDGDLSSGLSWSSNLDGTIGSGATFSTSVLTAGTHTITASVTDSGALIGSATITVTVLSSITSIIIDNGDPETSYTLQKWYKSSGPDYYGTQSVFSRKANNKYNYDVTLSGSYDISLWWTSSLSRCTSVPVEIYNGTTLLDTVTVNHQENGGDWNPIGIGAYTFTGQAKVSIVSTAVGSCTTSADAVRFVSSGTPGNTAPIVTITAPADGSSFNEGDSITFTGTATDIEDGDLSPGLSWGSNLEGTIDSGATFSTSTLSSGTHTITASVTDSGGLPGSATITITVVNVGIGGYYVGMGDSITKGLDDDEPSDDSSSDGKNTGGGYEPILNDLLTAFRGYPHNIANEGVPGDTSVDGVFNISAVLSRHQNASRFLVQYGTNDAKVSSLPIPSGLGLNPVDPGYPGSFKENMQQIIDAIINVGKEVSLAKIPIALASCNSGCDPYPDPSQGQKNIIIKEFNEVIDELVADPLNNISVIGPDFYAYFSYLDPATNRFRFEDEYATYYHPNGIGYQSMANLWFQALTQTAPVVAITLPVNDSSFNESDSITFTGTATDSEDGNISYSLSWSSNLDGVIGSGATFSTSLLSAGTHTITAAVIDSGGLIDSAIITVTVLSSATSIIIDNGDPETSYTIEKWWNSSGPDYYGTQSVFSRKAGNKYIYDVALSGSYDISLWWTSSLSRCTVVPVEIYNGTTLLDTVTVNHQENGGDWNPIGIGAYTFTGQAKVSIVSTAVGSCTTSADAVKFVNSE